MEGEVLRRMGPQPVCAGLLRQDEGALGLECGGTRLALDLARRRRDGARGGREASARAQRPVDRDARLDGLDLLEDVRLAHARVAAQHEQRAMAAHHEVEQQLLQLPLLTGTAIGAEERDLLVGRRARALRRRGRAACRALALGTAAAMRAVSAERLAHRLEDGHRLILALDLNGVEHIPAAAAARRGVARL
eukprot:scaffold126434_cov57-Phaeocystis_antarctica.AAC.1